MNEEIILNVETNSPYVIGAVAYVEQLENGAKITIVDKNGTTTATVYDGNDGKGISSITLNGDYTLTINYTDGDSTTTSSIRGETGASGVYYGEEEPLDPDISVWVDPNGDSDEDLIPEAVDKWLEEHPEATTTVEDASLTEEKFTDELKLKAIKDYVTLEMFGAKGDGVTDDTKALTDAIANGGKIVVLNTYYIGSMIELGDMSSVTIDGCGVGTIKCGGDYLFECQQFASIEMDGLSIDGGNRAYGVCEWLTPADSVHLNKCEFYNFVAAYNPNDSAQIKFPISAAFSVADCYAEIKSCKFYNNIGHGLLVRGSVKECFITDCIAHHNGCNVSGTRTAISVGIGAYAEPHDGGSCIISNCVAYYNGASGIAPHDIASQTIIGCCSYNNWEHGIVIQECERGIISNCITKGNDSYGIRVQGDFAQDSYYCSNVKVCENVINDGNGVWVGANCQNVEVSNNNITAGSTAFMTDSSTTDNRNPLSRNVSFHDNTVEENGNFAGKNTMLKNPFTGLAKYNNRTKDGKLMPNGFVVNVHANVGAYANYAPIYEDETDYNLLTSISPNLFAGTTLSDGTLTYGGSSTGQAFEYRIPLNSTYSKVTALFMFDEYDNVYPCARLRNSGGSEVTFLDQKPAFYSNIKCLQIEIDLTNDAYKDGYLCAGLGFGYDENKANQLTNFRAYLVYGQKIKANI